MRCTSRRTVRGGGIGAPGGVGVAERRACAAGGHRALPCLPCTIPAPSRPRNDPETRFFGPQHRRGQRAPPDRQARDLLHPRLLVGGGEPWLQHPRRPHGKLSLQPGAQTRAACPCRRGTRPCLCGARIWSCARARALAGLDTPPPPPPPPPPGARRQVRLLRGPPPGVQPGPLRGGWRRWRGLCQAVEGAGTGSAPALGLWNAALSLSLPPHPSPLPPKGHPPAGGDHAPAEVSSAPQPRRAPQARPQAPAAQRVSLAPPPSARPPAPGRVSLHLGASLLARRRCLCGGGAPGS
jgi:hypothetical protein